MQDDPESALSRHTPVKAGDRLYGSRYSSPGFPAPAPDLIQGSPE